jgi:RarD protein
MSNLKMILGMTIFGSIGIFVHEIGLPPAVIASIRAIVGTAFLAIILGFYSNRANLSDVKKNLLPIIISGTALGFNWIFLFQAYQQTTIPVATVCYNLAPVFVLVLSPILLRERVTPVSIACTLGALAGAILLSGITSGDAVNKTGVTYAIIAAILYAVIMLTNKKISGISSLDNAFYQMAVASVVTIAYSVFTVDMSTVTIGGNVGWMLLVLGILHTAVAYALVFSASKRMTAQAWGILSYLEPATAIVLAFFLLKQPITNIEILGAVMVFGFALINGLVRRKRG